MQKPKLTRSFWMDTVHANKSIPRCMQCANVRNIHTFGRPALLLRVVGLRAARLGRRQSSSLRTGPWPAGRNEVADIHRQRWQSNSYTSSRYKFCGLGIQQLQQQVGTEQEAYFGGSQRYRKRTVASSHIAACLLLERSVCHPCPSIEKSNACRFLWVRPLHWYARHRAVPTVSKN